LGIPRNKDFSHPLPKAKDRGELLRNKLGRRPKPEHQELFDIFELWILDFMRMHLYYNFIISIFLSEIFFLQLLVITHKTKALQTKQIKARNHETS